MAYGTTSGLQLNIDDYDDLLADGTLTAANITAARTKADSYINAKLAAVHSAENLPLSPVPAAIDSISDDWTTCILLTRLATGKDPDRSEWVQSFCDAAESALEDYLKDPTALDSDGNALFVKQFQNNRNNEDKKFSITRTSNGNIIGNRGTMDGW